MSLGSAISAKIRGCDERGKWGGDELAKERSCFWRDASRAMGTLAASSFAQQPTADRCAA